MKPAILRLSGVTSGLGTRGKIAFVVYPASLGTAIVLSK